MGLLCDCFGGGGKRMTKEEERLASDEARAKAAEAAQKRSVPPPSLPLSLSSSVFHSHCIFGSFFYYNLMITRELLQFFFSLAVLGFFRKPTYEVGILVIVVLDIRHEMCLIYYLKIITPSFDKNDYSERQYHIKRIFVPIVPTFVQFCLVTEFGFYIWYCFSINILSLELIVLLIEFHILIINKLKCTKFPWNFGWCVNKPLTFKKVCTSIWMYFTHVYIFCIHKLNNIVIKLSCDHKKIHFLSKTKNNSLFLILIPL